jgi:hypothetical protein
MHKRDLEERMTATGTEHTVEPTAPRSVLPPAKTYCRYDPALDRRMLSPVDASGGKGG